VYPCLTDEYPNSLALGNCNWHSATMKYGRLVRVSPSQKKGYATYVVAEEDATKAVAMIRTLVGTAPNVESIGRASLKLLLAVGLSAGEFKKAES
jgi:hypothetical protein